MEASDKELALELIHKFHRESMDVIGELCKRHMDERTMTTEENIMYGEAA